MIVVKYKSKTDLGLHIGEVLAYEGRTTLDPNGRYEVTGPGLLDRRFKASVQLRDGRIDSIR